jgi:hypothetical protein
MANGQMTRNTGYRPSSARPTPIVQSGYEAMMEQMRSGNRAPYSRSDGSAPRFDGPVGWNTVGGPGSGAASWGGQPGGGGGGNPFAQTWQAGLDSASADRARIAGSAPRFIGDSGSGGGGGFGGDASPRYDTPSSMDDPYTKAALDKLGQVGKEGLITPGDVADQEAGIATQSQAAANARQQQINRLASQSGEVAGSAAVRAATLRNQQARQNQTIAGQADVRRAATEANRSAQVDAITKAGEFRLRQLAQEPKQRAGAGSSTPTLVDSRGNPVVGGPTPPTTGGPMPPSPGGPPVTDTGPGNIPRRPPAATTMGPGSIPRRQGT